MTVVTTHRAGVAVGLTVNSLRDDLARSAARLLEPALRLAPGGGFPRGGSLSASACSPHTSGTSRSPSPGAATPIPPASSQRSHDGPPAVAGALASFACRTRAIHDGGRPRDCFSGTSSLRDVRDGAAPAPSSTPSRFFRPGPGARIAPVGLASQTGCPVFEHGPWRRRSETGRARAGTSLAY